MITKLISFTLPCFFYNMYTEKLKTLIVISPEKSRNCRQHKKGKLATLFQSYAKAKTFSTVDLLYLKWNSCHFSVCVVFACHLMQ